MYIDIGANSGREILRTEKQNTATSGQLIKTVYVSYVYVYIFLYKLVSLCLKANAAMVPKTPSRYCMLLM
jgi:hypothetical protein